MPPLLVTSDSPGAGRTTVAAALAQLAVQAGRRVWLARLEGGPSSQADAATLAAVPGVRAPARPVAVAAVAAAPARAAVIAEAPAGSGADPASLPGARRLLVVRAGDPVPPSAPDLAGVVVTFAPAGRLEEVRARFADLPLLAVLAEDRLLAAPTVGALAAATGARVLYRHNGVDESLENVMVGTVAADPGTPYFRRAGRKAVITRFDKVDVILAAMFTEVSCLLLTGGYEPLEYVLDRLQNSGAEMTVLLSDGTTVEAMRALEETYGRTPFAGARKLARAAELLGEQLRLEELAL